MSRVSNLILRAPLEGWCAPLDDVPDAVFSGRMLGDGLAIDPTVGVVTAPCDGIITTVPAGGHAVSIRTAGGVDVLIHVGIDTVQLGGRGFTTRVAAGQRVRSGEELLKFDLEVLARAAKSLFTPIVISAESGVSIVTRHPTGAIRAGEVLMQITVNGAAATAVEASATDADSLSGSIAVPLRHGIHARPAALLTQRARAYGAELTISVRGKSANARSVVALMALGARHGDVMRVTARGGDAAAALRALEDALAEALRLELSLPAEASPAPAARAPASAPVAAGVLCGVTAVAGFAVGRAARMQRAEIRVTEAGQGVEHESAAFERARASVRARLARTANEGPTTRRELVGAHLEFLEDPELISRTVEEIARGHSAGFAWRHAVRQSIAALETLEDVRLRQRADDLLDIESQLLVALTGETRPANFKLPAGAVLVADDLLPSELMALDRDQLAAICLAGGGATSHVAILAAALDVPMLIGLGTALRQVPAGAQLIVDATHGELQIDPTAAGFAQAESRARALHAERARARAAAQRECRTHDGTRIEVFANLGSVADAQAAVGAGAEGCGLLRTEFLFIDRETAPAEAEQLAVYQAVADALAGRPLVLRLMDVGGDKPLAYLPMPREDNPALGLRGIRTALWRQDLLHTQLRAALRVTPSGIVRLLLPMITDVSEIAAVRALVNELSAELGARRRIELGAMIETPAAALMAAQILPAVDFLSIGSNDLTQYTLAMDRGHPELARRVDALHPAVLKLMAAASAASVAAGKLVAVCGGVAADAAAIPLLIGWGVRELSVVPGAIPALKRQIGSLSVSRCEALAARALQLGSAGEVRELVAQQMRYEEGTP